LEGIIIYVLIVKLIFDCQRNKVTHGYTFEFIEQVLNLEKRSGSPQIH